MSLDKFKGCLIGGAAGDALGYEIEFWGNHQIFDTYGPQGIQEYELNYGEALISDDTQMTLFTAVGLLNEAAKSVENEKYSMLPLLGIWDAYYEWYQMQYNGIHTKSDPKVLKRRKTWLFHILELRERRAPGMACMGSLRGKIPGSIEDPINNSKGCGGVMRVAPVGLFFNRFPEKEDRIAEVNYIAAGAAALTHGHPLGYLTAAVLAHIVNRIACGGCTYGDSLKDIILESMDYLQKLYPETAYSKTLCDLLQKAMELTENGKDDLENITELGEGWVAEETLAIAIYCALKYQDDFSKAICVSVNHKGDSDSTGAVTGNILGAWIGYEQIPAKWKKNLECHNTIVKVAEDLYRSKEVMETKIADDTWKKRYLEMEKI